MYASFQWTIFYRVKNGAGTWTSPHNIPNFCFKGTHARPVQLRSNIIELNHRGIQSNGLLQNLIVAIEAGFRKSRSSSISNLGVGMIVCEASGVQMEWKWNKQENNQTQKMIKLEES